MPEYFNVPEHFNVTEQFKFVILARLTYHEIDIFSATDSLAHAARPPEFEDRFHVGVHDVEVYPELAKSAKKDKLLSNSDEFRVYGLGRTAPVANLLVVMTKKGSSQ